MFLLLSHFLPLSFFVRLYKPRILPEPPSLSLSLHSLDHVSWPCFIGSKGIWKLIKWNCVLKSQTLIHSEGDEFYGKMNSIHEKRLRKHWTAFWDFVCVNGRFVCANGRWEIEIRQRLFFCIHLYVRIFGFRICLFSKLISDGATAAPLVATTTIFVVIAAVAVIIQSSCNLRRMAVGFIGFCMLLFLCLKLLAVRFRMKLNGMECNVVLRLLCIHHGCTKQWNKHNDQEKQNIVLCCVCSFMFI